jgi:hypothetical protein
LTSVNLQHHEAAIYDPLEDKVNSLSHHMKRVYDTLNYEN